MIDGTTQKGLVEKQASRDALIPTIRRGRKEDSCVNEERFFHHRKILPFIGINRLLFQISERVKK